MKENNLKRFVYLGFVMMLSAFGIMIGLVLTNNIIPDFVDYMFRGGMIISIFTSILIAGVKGKNNS